MRSMLKTRTIDAIKVKVTRASGKALERMDLKISPNTLVIEFDDSIEKGHHRRVVADY